MGERDIVTKEYMADPVVFADAFNYLLHGGKPVIDAGRLRKKDTAELAVLYGKDEKVGAVQKYRDNLKALTLMEDDRAEYLILGIEGQTGVDYAMSVRNMLYDALQYAEQVKQITKENRKAKKLKKEEFLSGFSRENKILPVITLVILFDTEPWDGPMSLYEMFSTEDKELLQFVSDYKLNLMEPAAMSDEEIKRLSSSLREVILFMKYASDKKQLTALMKQSDRFRKIDRQAANVINTLLNCSLKFEEKREELDMCKALDDMREDARMEGERIGIEKGIEKMRISIENLMKNLMLSQEEAMDALGIPRDERQYYVKGIRHV